MDSRKCQTPTATPPVAGDLPIPLANVPRGLPGGFWGPQRAARQYNAKNAL